MIPEIIQIKKTDRPWHLPVIAGICMGIPIMAGYFTGYMQEAKLASLASLVILHLQSNHLATRMLTLVSCCFGIMLSFTIGSVFSFNPTVAPIALGIYAFIVHIGLFHLQLTRPPGNFFFIMIASVSICMPFHPPSIASHIGYVGIGTMISCCLGLVYSLLTLKKGGTDEAPYIAPTDKQGNVIESLIIGTCIGASLFAANLLKLENPYWVPTSCIAVMQGISVSHVVTRGLQRILGTLIGLFLAWGLLALDPSTLTICLSIIVAQVLVEFLVVRNYAIAVIFITVLTIFLAEVNPASSNDSGAATVLFKTRMLDIALGCAIGCIGGWLLYNERVHYHARRQIRKTKLALHRR
jgi:uncharacterized membrane protein YgaE (UPF0421/DUF939 family)